MEIPFVGKNIRNSDKMWCKGSVVREGKLLQLTLIMCFLVSIRKSHQNRHAHDSHWRGLLWFSMSHFYLEGILPKGPYLPCVSMAGRALLAGYPWSMSSIPKQGWYLASDILGFEGLFIYMDSNLNSIYYCLCATPYTFITYLDHN